MRDDLISVIIPIYNREQYLRRCIDSALNQSDVITEIILIDDGSTDNSPQIIEEYVLNNTNVKSIHTKNSGVSHARNCGLKAATGKYISFIDSDDYLEPDAMISMKKSLEESGADYCIGRINFFSDTGDFDHSMVFPEHYQNKLLSKDYVWQTIMDVDFPIFDLCTSKLYKRELWDNLYFVEGKTSEDTLALLEIQKRCDKVYFLDKIVYNITLSEVSLMRCKQAKTFIDEAAADFVLSEYLLKTDHYDEALRRFGDGTRSLISASKETDDIDLRKEIDSIYNDYRLLSMDLSKHVNVRNRIRFAILRFSFPLYSFIRIAKIKLGAAQ